MEILVLAISAILLALVQGGVWIVTGLSRRAGAAVPIYLRALAIGTVLLATLCLVLVPALIIIKIFTGWSWALYMAAFLAVVFTLPLGALWTPMAVALGTVFGDSTNPLVVGRRYLHGVSILLFAELMLSLGLLIVPFHNNYGMLPAFALVAAAVVVAGMIWGGWLSAGFYRGVAGLAFLVILLSFFLPRTFDVVREKAGRIDEGLAGVLTAQPATQARMAGKPLCAEQITFRPDFEIAPEMKIKIFPDCWSGWVAIPNQANFRISSPDRVEILTPRGEWFRFGPDEARWLGEVRFSTFRLSGEGQAVVFVERR